MQHADNQRQPPFRLMRSVTVALLTTCAGTAWAGGAYLYEVAAATEIATATAAPSVRAQDAGTVFTNPAGMTRFDEPQLLVNGTAIYIHANFKPDREQTTIAGSDGQTSEWLPMGALQYIHPVSDNLMLGVSVHNFAGLTLDWSADWVGRYDAVNTTLMAPQLQPTIAYKVNDWLSVGGGVDLTMGYLRDKARVNNLEPGRPDGKLSLSDWDFSLQGNFGIMLAPSENTRIGLRYLTKMDLEFESNIRFSGLGPLLDESLNEVGDLDLGLTIPQSVSVGVFHQLDDQWAVLGGVGWDDWSDFGLIKVKVQDLTGEIREELKFRDTWHFGIGAQYQYSPDWQYSAGISYDSNWQTEATRAIELPLGAMYRYGFGVEYQKRKNLTIGAAAELLWEGNLPVASSDSELNGSLAGKYGEKVFIGIATVYAKWTF
jgi:long-chain fatty acid transport protein